MPKKSKQSKKRKLTLESPVSMLKGFGEQAVKRCATLGIKTVKDMLTYFPFRYDDYRPKDLSTLPDKAKVSMVGHVSRIPNRRYHGKMNVTTFPIAYDHDKKAVWVSFFNKPWLIYKVHQNDTVLVYGQYHRTPKFTSINGSHIKVLHNYVLGKADIVKPIYPSHNGIKQYKIQNMVKDCYTQTHQLIHDVVPQPIRAKYRLEDEATVIHDMHFPKTSRAEHLARRTAIFTEFYQYELRLAKLKADRTKSKGVAVHYDKHLLRRFDNSLPFKMTEGQLRSVYEIVTNLADGTQMNRLLQGDVGSGKTVVAAFGILATISADYQAAIMIPTSVLGEQHYKTFKKLFKGLDVNILLMKGEGEVTASEQKREEHAVASGKAQLVIGTDALIQSDVHFHKLGLAVIDEQHKFGVDQRKALVNKGDGVNTLSMTATPIPRTLAITAYGDMDISIIDTLPKGRKPVITKWIRPIQFSQYVPFIKSLLAKGQQAYCVVPLVQQTNDDDSNDDSKNTKGPAQLSLDPQMASHYSKGQLDLFSKPKQRPSGDPNSDKIDAVTEYQKAKKEFAPYRVSLLHGQMDDSEKDKVLHDFKAGKIQLLVSTTVVEVGVDAPKATMMIIKNADSYGLAQLHQLRGRIGRNSLQSYCLLVSSPKTLQSRKRMQIMESTNSGFVVAQEDLRLRGSGDALGNQQAGVPQFAVGDPISNSNILEYARKEAQNAVKNN